MSMVARAIDVLVSNYSHSIKTGSYLKGIKVEKTSVSSGEHVSSPRSTANISASGIDTLGKSYEHESGTRVEKESFNRSSNISTSDSEDGTHFESLKTATRSLQKVDKVNILITESVSSEVQPSSSQNQRPGLGNNPLNASISERQELLLTSPAISPDEMYSFVFAPVEEEMVGEPSYLVSVIVEFLRR